MSTPAQLMDRAKCIDCTIPPGMLIPVLIAITAQSAGVSLDPKTLMAQATCIDCTIPAGMQMSVLIALFDHVVNP